MTASQQVLSICIVNWNTAQDLLNCLSHLYAESGGVVGEVIVVDNGSRDRSVERVRREFPQVMLLARPKNEGYSRAANRGVRASKGEYILVLNPDVIIKEGTLKALVEFMENSPSAGCCGPRMLNPDGSLQPSCRSFPTLSTGLFRSTFLGRLFPKNLATAEYLMTNYNHEKVVSVDWLSGACLAFRRKALEELGGFDEDFFMFCEDVDICYRMRKAGWENYYVPQAVVVHKIGSSTNQAVAKMTLEWHKSMYRFYKKHYAGRYFVLVRPLIVLGIALRCTAALGKTAWFWMRGRMAVRARKTR